MSSDHLHAIENEFAETLSAVIARDAALHPADGPLVRVLLRWFETEHPRYFTLHLLGASETASADGFNAWLGLEWDNLDRELERTERVVSAPELEQSAVQLERLYAAETARTLAVEGAAMDVEQRPGEGVSRAVWETIRLLPSALARADVPLTPEFAATATHFHATGGLDVLRDTATPEALAALEARDELPWP